MDPTTLQAMQVLEVYSFIGMIVCAVLFLYSIDKAYRAPKATPPIVGRSTFVWVRCPNGHCKVNANRDWSCPECGAQLKAEDDRSLWAAMEAA